MASTTPTSFREASQRGLRDDEALTWLARLLRPEITGQDTQAFALWLRLHPDNAAAFDRATELWELTAGLPPDAAAGESSSGRPYRSPFARVRFALAATFLLGMLGLSLFLSDPGAVKTSEGEQWLVQLDDGSRVWLNTASAISARVDAAGDRQVTLIRGEAFFDIAPDDQHPFTIHSGSVRITVVGTRFNVWNDGNRTRVDVESGEVRLNPLSKGSPRETTRVEAGQSAAGDAEGIQSLLSAKGNRLDRWRDGRIVYDDVPLGEVVSDLDRYIPGTLALADEDLAMLEVSAVLHLPDGTDADPNDLLDALTTSLDLSWSEVPGELKLISRK